MPRVPDPELAARRRREILEAALVCFRRRGFHQATMQEICAEARVSPGALYRYFASKADIIAAIAAEEHARIEPLFQSLAEGAGLVETLGILAQEWLTKFADDDAPLIADVIAECVRDRDLGERVVRDGMAVQMRLANAIGAAQARGEIAPDLEPMAVVRVLSGTLDGLGLRVALLRDIQPKEAAEDFMRMVRRYLDPQPAPAANAARSHPQKPVIRKKAAEPALVQKSRETLS